MRAVFMGTPDFAVGALDSLVSAGHEVALVITQPDKPKGRKKTLTPPPVKERALEHGLPVYQPARVRGAECIEKLKEIAPDVIVVAAFGQIIPKEILELPRYGCINIHASLLPKYRGAAPIQWAVIDGEKESGVTLMRMDEGLDTGDMIARAVVPLAEDETGGSLFDRLSAAGARLLADTLPLLEQGKVSYERQPEESPTPYARMMTKEMGRIDWEKPAAKLERLIRGLNPWPTAYTSLDGRQVKLWRARVGGSGTGARPGEVLESSGGALAVQTGDGVLEILELQMEGKKRMDAEAFLRGHRIGKGTVLGQ